jgi:transposase
MEDVRFVGLDVHKDSIAIAVAESGGGEPALLATIPSDVSLLLKRLRRLGAVRCCYEAGPTGFALQRQLADAGIACVVIAPSLTPVRAGDRIKTDRRDAVRLARFLRSGDLTEVHVPDAATEAIRDLERARDAAKRAERTARQQLSRFLLRHARRYDEGIKLWTKKHLDWVRRQRFDHEAQNRVLADYIDTVERMQERVDRLSTAIAELVEGWHLAPLVKALQAFRGVKLVTAVIIVAEVCDMTRFGTAPRFMGYLGLVPSEHSSGDSRIRGGITRTGNKHVRRVLIEAAWAYRFRAAMSPEIRQRNKPVSPEVRRIAWKAQERLCRRYRMMIAKGKPQQKVVAAIARELAGFIWSAARQEKLLAA